MIGFRCLVDAGKSLERVLEGVSPERVGNDLMDGTVGDSDGISSSSPEKGKMIR